MVHCVQELAHQRYADMYAVVPDGSWPKCRQPMACQQQLSVCIGLAACGRLGVQQGRHLQLILASSALCIVVGMHNTLFV